MNSPETALIEGGQLHAHFSTSDAITMELVEEAPAEKRADVVRNLVQVGARAVRFASDRLGSTNVVDAINTTSEQAMKHLRDTSKEATSTIERQMKATFGKEGALERMLSANLDALKAELYRKMDPSSADSILAGFIEIEKRQRAQVVEDVRGIFDVDRPGSVAAKLAALTAEQHKIAMEQIAAVREALAVRSAVKLEAARGTQKGFDLEDAVEAIGNAWCLPRHDTLIRCGTQTGLIAGSKAGDVVIELAARSGVGAKIVLEVRDRPASVPAVKRDLGAAMKNRGALVGVYVTTVPVTRGTPWLYFLEPDKVAVVIDPDDDGEFDPTLLYAALEVARAQAFQAAALEDGREFDPTAVAAVLERLRADAARFTEMKRQISALAVSVTKGTDRLAELVDAAATSVRESAGALAAAVEAMVDGDDKAA